MSSNWNPVLEDIFKKNIPERASWKSQQEILSILKKLGTSHNHMFYPRGGGKDLDGAKSSSENKCISLVSGESWDVCNPESLSFYCPKNDLEWSCFRLNLNTLPVAELEGDDIDPKEISRFGYQEVADIGDAEYITRSHVDKGFLSYDQNGCEIPLPQNTRVVTRILNGSLIISDKFSHYNQLRLPHFDAYNGKHNNMTKKQFENYIDSLKDELDQAKSNSK